MDFVTEHYALVRRLYMGRFAARVRTAGLDTEDVLQVALLKLLRLQQGRAAYNPGKASPSTYIYMVISGAVSNELDKARRRWWEQVGGKEDAAIDPGRDRVAVLHESGRRCGAEAESLDWVADWAA